MLNVDAARTLMADSLAFHIIFALLGVGLPLVILLIEQQAIRKKDPIILEHARRISYVTLVLVVAGVASGTIIAIQMSMMWSGLIKFGGPIMGLAFGWEGYAFMIEAVFLAFYVSTWKKIKGWRHWWLGVPVALGSLGSAFAITLGNAWMQNPGVLEITNGVVQTTDPLAHLLSKTAFFMIAHSVSGYYLATLLCVLGVYAYYYLRYKPVNESKVATQKIMLTLSVTAVVFIVMTGIIGHFQTRYLAQSQPRKFATMELNATTRENAPYIIGGHWKEDGTVEGGIRIPSMLSIMVGDSPSTTIIGLQDFPKETWPMLFINLLFELKMLLVGLVTITTLIFTSLHYKRIKQKYRDWRYKKPMLIALLPLGPLAIIIVELGWMIAEFGRQPFVVNGYLLTSEAFSGQIGSWGYVFPILFLILFIVTSLAILILMKRHGKIKPKKGVF